MLLIEILLKLNVGCHIQNAFISTFFYAGDMAFLSPSLKGLQKMLLFCSQFCSYWDICLNPKKSKNVYFGRRQGILCNLKLDIVSSYNLAQNSTAA